MWLTLPHASDSMVEAVLNQIIRVSRSAQVYNPLKTSECVQVGGERTKEKPKTRGVVFFSHLCKQGVQGKKSDSMILGGEVSRFATESTSEPNK